MAMDVVTIQYLTDCTTRGTRIHFELDIPVPPDQADTVKSTMDSGDWATFKTQVKAFAPVSVSAAADYLLSVAPQKAKSNTTPATKTTTST